MHVHDVRMESVERRPGSPIRKRRDRGDRALIGDPERPADRPDPGLRRLGGRRREHHGLVSSFEQARGQIPDVHLDPSRRLPCIGADERDPHGSQPGWNRCQSGGAAEIACSNAAARAAGQRDDVVFPPARGFDAHRGQDLDPAVSGRVRGPRDQRRPRGEREERRSRGHPPGTPEHLDLDAPAGEVAVRHERHDAVLLQPLGELPAHVVARQIDDLDPEQTSVLDEELEQFVRLQVLGDRHDRGHPEPHRPAADVPVAGMRKRDHDALAVRQALLDVLDPLEAERLQHTLVAPAEHVERVEPVPPVEGESLTRGRLHQRVGHLTPQYLRLVRRNGRPSLGGEAEEEPVPPPDRRSARSSWEGSGRASSRSDSVRYVGGLGSSGVGRSCRPLLLRHLSRTHDRREPRHHGHGPYRPRPSEEQERDHQEVSRPACHVPLSSTEYPSAAPRALM